MISLKPPTSTASPVSTAQQDGHSAFRRVTYTNKRANESRYFTESKKDRRWNGSVPSRYPEYRRSTQTYLPSHQLFLVRHPTKPHMELTIGDITYHHNGREHFLGNINLINLVGVDCLHYHSCIRVKETTLPLNNNLFKYTVSPTAMQKFRNGYQKDLVDQYLDFFEKTSPDFMWGTFYPTRQDRLHGKSRHHGTRIIGLYETVARLFSFISRKILEC